MTGTVRRSGAVVRITADLVGGHHNETLWSQRFDRPVTDLFEVRHQISTSIVGAVEPVYLRREELRTSQSEAPDLQYWELLMRARWHFWRTNAIPVEQLCRVLEVSRSGYYAARKRRQTLPALCEASVQLKAAFAASGGAQRSLRLRPAVAL